MIIRSAVDQTLPSFTLVGLMVPPEALVIPLYFHLRSAGLTDSYWALILPQTAQSLAVSIFWMRDSF
ncbi:hypothetical protein AB0I98_18790 [Streptomyces sp. NPDC050211]|uniref:hypothetical protein n=1 Tax=Streptomyces sp. NPDC050211 TaxID=3154932 RepID=UPI00344A40C0